MMNQLRVCVRVLGAVSCVVRGTTAVLLSSVAAALEETKTHLLKRCHFDATTLFFLDFLSSLCRFPAFKWKEFEECLCGSSGIPGMHMWVKGISGMQMGNGVWGLRKVFW